jgi:archaellum component FlaD/FlaE
MKTDERMAERIAHLERDIKVLKSEVQAVLVDLRDKYLSAENPLNAPSAPATSQQVIVLQSPAANEAKDKKEEQKISSEAARDKVEEQKIASEAAKDKAEEQKIASEAAKDKAEEQKIASEAAKDKAEEQKIASEAGRGTHPEPARGEVIQAQIPEEVPGNTKQRREHIPDRDINMISIVGMVNWAEESVKKLGYQKTEAILDVAEMMGLLSPQLKQIMTKLINIDNDGNSQSVSARVFLDSLVKITTLLGKDNQTEAALLSIMSREDGHG